MHICFSEMPLAIIHLIECIALNISENFLYRISKQTCLALYFFTNFVETKFSG